MTLSDLSMSSAPPPQIPPRTMARAALEASFQKESRALFAMAYRITGMATEAEDVVQETFARALASPPPDLSSPLGPWLTRVAANLAKDALRRRKRRPYFGPWLPEPLEDGAPLRSPIAEDAPDPTPGPEARYSLAESASYAFLCALERLGPRERTVLVLRDVMGLDAEETAAALETSPGNVRVIHHRARTKLALDDDALRVSSETRRARTMSALGQLLAAIGSGEIEAITRLLADDCVLETDAAGEFHAVVVRVTGKERIAATQLGTASHLVVQRTRLAILNDQPAVILDVLPERKRQAARSVLLLEVGPDDRIRAIRAVLATAKLAHVT